MFSLETEEKPKNYALIKEIVFTVFSELERRFQIFSTAIKLNVKTTTKLILTECLLHNFLKGPQPPFNNSQTSYTPQPASNMTPQNIRQEYTNFISVLNL